jgi:hypothetical protein
VCCAQPLPFDPTPLQDVIQDRAGRIWGIHRDSGLSRWDGQRWQATEVSLPGLEIADPPTQVTLSPHAFPLLLQTNLQGTAYVCWAGSDGFAGVESPFWITRLADGEPPQSAAFSAQLASAFVAFGSDGIGWLTEAGPRIYRIGPDLKVELAYTIRSNQMAGTRFDQYNPVQAVSDGAGGVLVWGEQRFRELATLRGLLLASDSGVVEVPRIEGLPETGFSFLTAVGPGLLWAGVPEWDPAADLYQIDLKAERVTRIPEPSPAAFAHVLGIHSVGHDRYVMAADRSPNQTLWRWRAGSWQKIGSPLDSAPFDDYYRISRPLVSDPHGTWIGTGGNGMLLVPASEGYAVATYDWRSGQPLESVHRIASLADGGMLLVGFGQGTTTLRIDDLVEGRTISSRILDVWKNAGNLQGDSMGHLWTLLGSALEEVSLAKWDGIGWKRHALPPQVSQGDLGFALGTDTLGRLWVPYRERVWMADRQQLKLTDKVVVFQPRTQKWQHFDSLESAIVDLVHLNDQARVNLPGFHQPDMADGHRICFLGTDWVQGDRVVHYYDGEIWRRWDLASVGFVRPGYIGLPFFTDEGTLAINISTTRRGNATALFDGQRWETAPFRSAGIRDPFNLSRPPGGRSRDGTLPGGVMPAPWKAERQQLIPTELGISIPQFRMEEVHPFLGARRVDQVWTDARGNLVLSTQLPAGNLSGHRQYVVLAPLDSKAPPRLELVKIEPGGVGVELQLGVGGASSAPYQEGFTAVEMEDGQMILHWAGQAILEVADQVEGPWTPIPHAASPHAVVTSNPSGFYRIRR